MTTNIAQRIAAIEPRVQFSADDLNWIENEIDKVVGKALPKLLKKRLISTLPKTLNAIKPITVTTPKSASIGLANISSNSAPVNKPAAINTHAFTKP